MRMPRRYPALPTRVDPRTCGCTDCIVGYSIPLEFATQRQLQMLLNGVLVNATGYSLSEFRVRTTIEPPEG